MRIDEAGRQAPQAAVAQARLLLQLQQLVEIQAQFGDRGAHLVVHVEIDQVVAQVRTHQEFGRHVGHGARPPAAALDQHRGGLHQAGLAHGLLPVGRVPDGPAPGQQPDQPRHLRRGARRPITELGLDFDELLQQEEEPGLGNGGLGRLAACFIDSLATLEIPALGYGIRYEFGIFHQEIVDGWQQESTDNWLRFGNPWEIARPEWAVRGEVRRPHRAATATSTDRLRVRWVPSKDGDRRALRHAHPRLPQQHRQHAAAVDAPRRPSPSTSPAFNRGDYYGAVNRKVASENISKVLYPNDEQLQGKELRLEQQYFFVSCSLQDMLRILRDAEAFRWSASTRSSRSSSTTRIRRSRWPS